MIPINWTPKYMGGYDYLIPTGSPYYVNVSAPLGSTRYVLDLFIWKGSKTPPAGLQSSYTIEKEILNRAFSLTVNISDYIRTTIKPVVHDIWDWQDYEDDMSWCAWKIRVYNGDTLTTTTNSLLFLATLGWRWSADTKFNKPEYDSNMRYLQWFTLGDYQYKSEYKIEMSANAPGVVYSYNFMNDVTSTNQVISRSMATDLTVGCIDYQILYITRLGVWEWFPLNGKVSVQTSSSKQIYKRHNRKSNIPSIFPSSGYYNKISTKKYLWSSSTLPDDFYIKYEEIIESPLIQIFNCNTNQLEFVDIVSCNYTELTVENNRNNLTYNIEFTASDDKIKTI